MSRKIQLHPLTALRVAADFVRDPIATMQWTYARYGPLVSVGFDIPIVTKPQHFILAVGARYNERVLGDPDTFHTIGLMPPGPPGSAQRRIRSGIVAMNGTQHAHYRRMMLPPLRRAVIDAMAERMSVIVERKIADWPLGKALDIVPLLNDIARNVALSALFGADTPGGIDWGLGAAELINAHVRMADSPAVRTCPVAWPGFPYWRMLRNAEKVEAYLTSWAAGRRGKLRADDLLSLIANSPDQHGNPPSDHQVATQVLTLFGASYETCQTALTWILLLIAQHPTVAAALLDEVSALPADAPLSPIRLEQCTWLDSVIKESMRILPPVPFQVRRAVRDADLVDCDVEAGTRVILSPLLTNRLSELYPDGDCFKPERWQKIAPSQYEYLVFSAGPRTCVGYWFGIMFLKTAIAHIVRRYRVALVPGSRIDCKVAIAMWPSRGVPVTVHAQDGRFSANPIRGNVCRMVRF
jgi:cytochrome P450